MNPEIEHILDNLTSKEINTLAHGPIDQRVKMLSRILIQLFVKGEGEPIQFYDEQASKMIRDKLQQGGDILGFEEFQNMLGKIFNMTSQIHPPSMSVAPTKRHGEAGPR